MSLKQPDTSPRCWVAVASADHVMVGRAGGFMQVCHGKGGPLRRIKPGDRVVYYSPSQQFKGKDKLQAFTAIGIVEERDPYQFDMGGGFIPFRRDVSWFDARPVPIRLLLEQLDFTSGNKHWGYQLRYGLFEISTHDMELIMRVMTEV
ncbi:EVE domain-containing protein [Microvirga sp. W0021]|uniref:UPF0310 protein WJT86_07160 n=1 Tax=Hohaiivirga grylli TaxID=3133970 RepID=A0ABV0BIM8_9HYPH